MMAPPDSRRLVCKLHKNEFANDKSLSQQDTAEHVNFESHAHPEPPHIKEEQEELWISQEEEQLQGLEETDITAVTVKSEYEEEEPQSSQLYQSQTEENREAEPLASSSTEEMKTEDDGEDCGVSEPAKNSYAASHLQPTSDDKTENSDDDWMETSEPQSGLDSQKNSDVIENTDFSCPFCGKCFRDKSHLRKHIIVHTGEKQFNCSVCGQGFGRKDHLKGHMIVHTGEKQFNCSICGKGFGRKADLKSHIIIHTGVKQFNCSVCGKGFVHKGNLKTHMIVHTGEKRFTCSICGHGCGRKGDLKTHMIVHTGEKLFNCTNCGKSFGRKETLNRHMTIHSTGK